MKLAGSCTRLRGKEREREGDAQEKNGLECGERGKCRAKRSALTEVVHDYIISIIDVLCFSGDPARGCLFG